MRTNQKGENMSTFIVTAISLNMRSQPKVVSSNRIAVLPNGHPVEQVHKEQAPWWLVDTVLHGVAIAGYVHAYHTDARLCTSIGEERIIDPCAMNSVQEFMADGVGKGSCMLGFIAVGRPNADCHSPS